MGEGQTDAAVAESGGGEEETCCVADVDYAVDGGLVVGVVGCGDVADYCGDADHYGVDYCGAVDYCVVADYCDVDCCDAVDCCNVDYCVGQGGWFAARNAVDAGSEQTVAAEVGDSAVAEVFWVVVECGGDVPVAEW